MIAKLGKIAFVAQLVEQLALNETVAGSNPAGGTIKKSATSGFFYGAPEEVPCGTSGRIRNRSPIFLNDSYHEEMGNGY